MSPSLVLSRRPIASADCYSAGERQWMTWSQQRRGRWLAPLLDGLTRLGATPDHVTLLSLAAGAAACGVWHWSPPAALAGLLLHVALDGLDGPLARRQHAASPRGSFTDTMADQAVVTAVAVTLMAAGTLTAPAGGLFIFLYAVVSLFAMIRNALHCPYAWLIRPRFLVYAWIPIELWLAPGSLSVLIWACNALLALSAATGFVAIRRGLAQRHSPAHPAAAP